MNKNIFLKLGSLFAFLSVLLGAFAAHALKTRLSPYFLEIFKTGVLYQFLHSIALLFIGTFGKEKLIKLAGFCFVIGIILFSGSLYALAITQISILGAITPLGGLAFLTGWALLFIYFYK